MARRRPRPPRAHRGSRYARPPHLQLPQPNYFGQSYWPPFSYPRGWRPGLSQTSVYVRMVLMLLLAGVALTAYVVLATLATHGR